MAVARYLRADIGGPARSWKVMRWVRKGLASPQLVDVPGRDLVLTFEDLVTLRMIAVFRTAYGHSLKRISTIEAYFRGLTGDPLPFATRPFWVDTSDIFAQLAEQLVSGVRRGQIAMSFLGCYLDRVEDITTDKEVGEAVTAFLRSRVRNAGLEFDERERASAWRPHPHVALRPTIQFGQPCIDGTRVPTRVVWGMLNRGNTIAEVADALDLDENEVASANEWEEKLQATP